MRIKLTEPQSTKYIYINHRTNQVHLLVPFVAGQEISTDNTCKATTELRHFFGKEGAIHELMCYQQALAFDIALLDEHHPLREEKLSRLRQIKIYLEAVNGMKESYGHAIVHFLKKPANLYSIQLRPTAQDPHSRVVSPVFSVERKNDSEGRPLSPLYQHTHGAFEQMTLPWTDPRKTLISAVLKSLLDDASFENIEHVLKTESQQLFGTEIHISETDRSRLEQYFETQTDLTLSDCVEHILGMVASQLWGSLTGSPFFLGIYSCKQEQAEHLSILTQFYLAHVNIYCHINQISELNFGQVLDGSPELSQTFADIVSKTLYDKADVELSICLFLNAHGEQFALNRPLTQDDKHLIQEKFESTYRTVTATDGMPNMDDFMILDKDARGENAKFFTYNGLICTDFANIVDSLSPNQAFFRTVREDVIDFSPMPSTKPIELDIEPLDLMKLTELQLARLSDEVKAEWQRSKAFSVHQFLHEVARGQQEQAQTRLKKSADTQHYLKCIGTFTDYSGRTFFCTAYEYAYWAKDKHMCRMLERYMTQETKAYLLARIEDLENNGLSYQQHGETIVSSTGVDLTRLVNALEHFAACYRFFEKTEAINRQSAWYNLQIAWLEVGIAQREVPAHVAQEYCRKDRVFDPVPDFNETILPRTFEIIEDDQVSTWFPISPDEGLGTHFSFIRSRMLMATAANLKSGIHIWTRGVSAQFDAMAIARLDEVRTQDRLQSRKNLAPDAPSDYRRMCVAM